MTVPIGAPVYEFDNGLWYDGSGFQPGIRYSYYGRLSRRRPSVVDSVIDLKGDWVVPAFGEAHNHNGGVPGDTATVRQYLDAGVFFVKNADNLPDWPRRSATLVNTPTGIDVSFADGGLTGPGGHPAELIARNIARGIASPADGEGAFYYSVASRQDVDRMWPSLMDHHPDFVKTYLLFSEEYSRRLHDSTYYGRRGLDPALLPYIVRRAHRAGLRVTTHIETAADFHNALVAGVDEIAHTPGFRPDGNDLSAYGDLNRYRISEADAQLAGRHKVVVVTTVSELLELLGQMQSRSPDLVAAIRSMITGNLLRLKAAGVTIALGSDRFRTNVVREVDALSREGLFDNLTLLRMWCQATPRTVFPNRDIGTLRDGAEASFLVLAGNPVLDIANTKRIVLRVKQGHILF